MSDFAYAYWVDDTVQGRPVQGVAVGFADQVSGQEHDAVIPAEAARRLAEQILTAVDGNEDR